jgi:hypothetical protein
MKPFVASLVSILFCLPAAAQEPVPKKPPAEFRKVFAAEAGTWDAVVKSYFRGPDGPVTESVGVETTEAICGGACLRSKFTFKLKSLGFEGHGLIGYDPRTKEYTATRVSNFVPTPYQSKGQYDAERKTLTMFSTITDQAGKEQRQKEVTKLVDETTKTTEFYDIVEKDGEKQEVKLMEMTLKKRS